MQAGDHHAAALGCMRKQTVFEINADVPGGIPYSEKNEVTGAEVMLKHVVTDLGLLVRASRQPDVKLVQIGHVDKSGAVNTLF